MKFVDDDDDDDDEGKVITPIRRSGMAHILKGSHSFTCTPHIHALTE